MKSKIIGIFLVLLSFIVYSADDKNELGIKLNLPPQADSIIITRSYIPENGKIDTILFNTRNNKKNYKRIINGIENIASYGIKMKPKCGDANSKIKIEIFNDWKLIEINMDIIPCLFINNKTNHFETKNETIKIGKNNNEEFNIYFKKDFNMFIDSLLKTNTKTP